MGFLTSLFGGSENTIVTVLLALGIVLVLIVLGVWALKLLFNATGNVGRGRNRRLNIVDSAAIDPKRQLVLVRRDNVEHLLVVGGSHDLIVESGITPPAEPTPIKRPKRRIAPLPGSLKPGTKSEPEPAVEVPATATPAPAPEKPDAASTNGDQLVKSRRSTSLRHTGLLRPANRVEPALHPQPSASETEIDDAVEDDSATKSAEPRNSAPEEPAIDETKDPSGGSESKDKRESENKAEATS